MQKLPVLSHYDAIVVGSGSGGATVANELTQQGKAVLILEKGSHSALKESFLGMAPIFSEVSVTDKLSTQRAISVGGSTAVWAAEVELPPLPTFKALGIDLSDVVYDAMTELPIAELPDDLISPQSHLLRESATSLGYDWKKNLMMIDQSAARDGYSYEAKWKARNYVESAVAAGAELITRAEVTKILTEQGRAVGVEFRKGRKRYTARAEKIVLSAGVAESPRILRASGIANVVNQGFYCSPGFLMFGTVADLEATDNYVGCMDTVLDEGIILGDGNLARAMFRMLMLSSLKFKRSRQFSNSIAIGGVVLDECSGELTDKGQFKKQLSDVETGKIELAKKMCRDILESANATDIVVLGPDAGVVGGVLTIGEHVDARLETKLTGLHVCDGSVLPADVRLHPTFTLICLGKYLSACLFDEQKKESFVAESKRAEIVLN